MLLYTIFIKQPSLYTARTSTKNMHRQGSFKITKKNIIEEAITKLKQSNLNLYEEMVITSTLEIYRR